MTPSTEFPMRRGKSKWGALGTFSVICAAVLGLCGLGGTMLSKKVDILTASGDLPDLAKQYRATGMPWVASQLVQPPVPDAENAAPLLKSGLYQAGWKNVPWDKAGTDLQKVSDLLDARKYDQAQAVLAPYRPSMDTLAQAAQRPRLDFKRDWDQGPQLLFPEFSLLKAAAKAFLAQARIESLRGDAQAAAHNLKIARQLGGLVGQDPIMIAMLVQVAIDAMTDVAAQRCAADLRSDPAALALLDKALQAPVHAPNFSTAFRGEAFMQVALCRNLSKFGGLQCVTASDGSGCNQTVDPSTLLRDGLPEDLTSRAFFSGMLRAWIKLAPLLNDPKTSPTEISNLSKQVNDQLGKDFKVSNMLANAIFPSFENAGAVVVKDTALERSTQALLQAMIIRQRTGAFPTSIRQIPGSWVDPFNLQPLHLKRTADGIRIYSVGQDLKDNGGLDRSELPTNAPYDAPCDVVAAYPPIVVQRSKTNTTNAKGPTVVRSSAGGD